MSTLATDKKRAVKAALLYALISAICGVFSAIYEHYSHGVYSPYMVYLFLFPLVLGALPFTLIAWFKRLQFPSRTSYNLYNSGVAALSVGSAIRGVLDIYGTQSDYIIIYFIAGILLLTTSIILYLASAIKSIRKKKL